MATSAEYNFPDTFDGDNINATQFTVVINGTAKDITNTTIDCVFKRKSKNGVTVKTISDSSGITKTDPVNGVFTIDTFNIDWGPGTYYYDIQFTDGTVVKTYIYGEILINKDVT